MTKNKTTNTNTHTNENESCKTDVLQTPKITKQSLQDDLVAVGHSKRHSKEAVKQLIEIITSELVAQKPVLLTKYGKLVPKFKKEGRPVRNPKTGEEMTMTATGTVTRAKVSSDEQQKTNTSKIKELLGESIGSNALADLAVSNFIEKAIESGKGGPAIEIRGFGSFKSRLRNEREGRNPRNGDKALVEEKIVPHFKISKELRARLTASYLSDIEKNAALSSEK